MSIIGHIIKAELPRHLTETEDANGFANRFVWVLVKRSKELPLGGEWYEVVAAQIVGRLESALEVGRSPVEVAPGMRVREKPGERSTACSRRTSPGAYAKRNYFRLG